MVSRTLLSVAGVGHDAIDAAFMVLPPRRDIVRRALRGSRVTLLARVHPHQPMERSRLLRREQIAADCMIPFQSAVQGPFTMASHFAFCPRLPISPRLTPKVG